MTFTGQCAIIKSMKERKKKEVIKMFVVVFNRYNPYKSYAMVANKRVGFKSFKTEQDAREFANTVNAIHIVNPIGNVVA